MARTITGTVISDKADKTIVINVTTRKTHLLYKKQYTVNTKYMAHDEQNQATSGDVVVISETRPISRRKNFSLVKIIERGGVRFEEKDATGDIPQEPEAESQKPSAKQEIKTSSSQPSAKKTGGSA